MPELAIHVTRAVPEEGLQLLRAPDVRLTVNPHDRPHTRAELEAALRGVDGAVVLLMDKVDAALLEKCPRLRAIGCYSVGVDNVDLAAAKRLGVSVANTPDVLTESTADLTFALMLGVARRILEGDRIMRAGQFPGWSPTYLLGTDVSRKTLGILGAGRIATAVERRARAFSMRRLYYSKERNPAFEDAGCEFVSTDELFTRSDFVSVHVSLNDQTRHLVDARALARMKRTAILINTARGPVVDERALVAALRAGEIAGAGLDVFEDEPLMAPGLAELPNVVLAPHVGSATRETRAAMSVLACRGVIEALRGKQPANWVPISAWPPSRS